MRDKSVQSEYISIREAASILGVTDQAIYLWLKEGRITHLKIQAKTRIKWLISREDFENFIEESRVPRTPTRKPGRPSIVNMEKTA